MPILITSRIAQQAAERLWALEAAIDALPPSREKARAVDTCRKFHTAAHRHFRLSGGVYVAQGDDDALQTAQESNATVIVMSGGTPKNNDDHGA